MPISSKASATQTLQDSPCLNANVHSMKFLSLSNAKDKTNGKRRSFTPMHSKKLRTPDVSPIIIITDPMESDKENSPSFDFLIRCKNYKDQLKKKTKLPNHRNSPINKLRISSPNISFKKNNSLLEHTLNMKLILEELKMMKYVDLFEAEEINFQVFLSLTEEDLKDIGIASEDISKMTRYIHNFDTPKKV